MSPILFEPAIMSLIEQFLPVNFIVCAAPERVLPAAPTFFGSANKKLDQNPKMRFLFMRTSFLMFISTSNPTQYYG